MNKKERKDVIEFLKGRILASLSFKSDRFRWVYWPCRGESFRRVLRRDELMKEIGQNTIIGRTYLGEVANKIVEDLET